MHLPRPACPHGVRIRAYRLFPIPAGTTHQVLRVIVRYCIITFMTASLESSTVSADLESYLPTLLYMHDFHIRPKTCRQGTVHVSGSSPCCLNPQACQSLQACLLSFSRYPPHCPAPQACPNPHACLLSFS